MISKTDEVKKIDEASARFVKEIEDASKRKLAEITRREVLRNYRGDDESVTSEEIYEQEKSKTQVFIKTGFAELDEYLGGGIAKKELIVLSGYTGEGKTTFCMDLTKNMQDHEVLWLPFEESAGELVRKLIKYGRPIPRFRTPKMTIRDDFDWIEERILENKIKYATEVVFIDNLHFITMDDTQEFVKTGGLAKKLKILAGQLDVAIVLIAHLRKSKDGMDKMPTLEDISGDSDAVKVADKVMAVWQERVALLGAGRRTEYTGITKAIVQKVRGAFGKRGDISYTWDRAYYTEISAAQVVQDLKSAKEEDAYPALDNLAKLTSKMI